MRLTRSLVPLLVLLAIGFLAVPAAVGQGPLGSDHQAGDDPVTVKDEDTPLGGGPLDFLVELDATTGAVVVGVGILGIAGYLAFQAFMGGTKFVNADNVLDNEARRSIFEYIQSHPGVHLRATASALNLSTTNVLWHLRKLEESKLVSSKKFEGYKVFYPVAGGMESKRRAIALAVLRNDNASDILEYILANPSAHQREIARALGVNHGTIRWHLRKLNDAGLVLQVKKEHTSQYYVSELGVQLLGEKNGERTTPTAEEMAKMAEQAAPAATPHAHAMGPVPRHGMAGADGDDPSHDPET